jgi:hypothetical protein
MVDVHNYIIIMQFKTVRDRHSKCGCELNKKELNKSEYSLYIIRFIFIPHQGQQLEEVLTTGLQQLKLNYSTSSTTNNIYLNRLTYLSEYFKVINPV